MSWKKITARIGIAGREMVLMTFENREDTSEINPNKPTDEICHETAVQNKVMT